jgi:hypothetical protein
MSKIIDNCKVEVAHPDDISHRWASLCDDHLAILKVARDQGLLVRATILYAPFGNYLMDLVLLASSAKIS